MGFGSFRIDLNVQYTRWECRTYGLSNGPLEGTNCLIKNIRRQSYGIRDDEYFFLKIWEATRRHPKNRVVYESPIS